MEIILYYEFGVYKWEILISLKDLKIVNEFGIWWWINLFWWAFVNLFIAK